MSGGWVKLHRKLLKSPLAKNADAMHLWLHLLLTVNHEDGEFILGNKVVDIPRGSLMTGRISLQKTTGLHQSKIQRLLVLFEGMGLIEQQTYSKYRLVSITNWGQYQDREQQVNSRRTASEQQVNTNKKVKKVKKDKKKEETRIYPAGLNLTAWQEYIAYRREAKIRKLTIAGENKQIEKVISYGGYDTQQQCIDQSIANGWQGIFPPSSNATPAHKSKATTFIDRVLDDGFH